VRRRLQLLRRREDIRVRPENTAGPWDVASYRQVMEGSVADAPPFPKGGAFDRKLWQYAACGLTSPHEIVSKQSITIEATQAVHHDG